MDFRVTPQTQQHTYAIGQGQGGYVREKVRILLHKVQEGPIEPFVKDQAVATPMRGDDCYTLIQRNAQLAGITGRLVFADQAELVANMAKERNFQVRQSLVKRNVSSVAWIEPLQIRQDFDELRTGFNAPVQFFDRVSSLWVDGNSRPELLRVQPGYIEDILVADEKVRFPQVQRPAWIVDSIHRKKDRLAHILRLSQLREKVVYVLLVGSRCLFDIQPVLPS